MITTEVYVKNYVELNCKYICPCGNKMYRKNRNYFTMNPMNTLSYAENVTRVKNRLKQKIRRCTKCGTHLKPEQHNASDMKQIENRRKIK